LEQLITLRKDLPTEKDKIAAGTGLETAIANLSSLKLLDENMVNSIGVDKAKILLNGLTLRLDTLRLNGIDPDASIPEIVEAGKTLSSRLSFEPEFSSSLYKNLAKTSPFLIWNLVQKDQSITDPSLRSAIANEMARRDPKKAMETVAREASTNEVKIIFGQWLRFESKEATEWFDQNSTSLPKEAVNQTSAAFADHSASVGNFVLAWDWVGRIEDPLLKRKAEGQVWQRERDKVRSEMSNDPVTTMDKIISNQTVHKDYWIEEALTSWISRDAAAAQKWYEANWKIMPSNKSQYVAAAYAKDSIKSHDFESAEKWLTLIQDPKTKQKVSEAINSARAGK